MLKFVCFNISKAQFWQMGGQTTKREKKLILLNSYKKNQMKCPFFFLWRGLRPKLYWNLFSASPKMKFFRCLSTTGSVAFSRQPECIRGRAMFKDNAPPQALKFKNYSPIRNAPNITIICYWTAVIGGSGQLCAGCYEHIEEEEEKEKITWRRLKSLPERQWIDATGWESRGGEK